MSKLEPFPRDTLWEGATLSKGLFVFLRKVASHFVFGDFTWDPPNVPAASTVDTTLDVATCADLGDLRAGMTVTVTPPSTLEAGIVIGAAWVSAHQTLTVRLANVTALAINPASGTWSFEASNTE